MEMKRSRRTQLFFNHFGTRIARSEFTMNNQVGDGGKKPMTPVKTSRDAEYPKEMREAEWKRQMIVEWSRPGGTNERGGKCDGATQSGRSRALRWRDPKRHLLPPA